MVEIAAVESCEEDESSVPQASCDHDLDGSVESNPSVFKPTLFLMSLKQAPLNKLIHGQDK